MASRPGVMHVAGSIPVSRSNLTSLCVLVTSHDVMEPDQDNAVRRKHRRHSFRRLKMVLLCLGVSGLVMGILLALYGYFLQNHTRLLAVGIGYILLSLALLGIRGAITVIRQIRSHEYEGE
jgi:hypothetical protein